MKQNEVFGSARWIGKKECYINDFFILRGEFYTADIKSAMLRVVGLGFFHCYINGVRVGEDLFLPLSTDYEPRENCPSDEIISGHRLYVPEYDVSCYLKNGKNVISIHFGGGWYTKSEYGNAKAIWYIRGEDSNGEFEYFSSENDKISASYISDYDFTSRECHDYTLYIYNAFDVNFDDSDWAHVEGVKAPVDTEYLFSDCPADRVQEIISPVLVSDNGESVVYDCKKNITGYPIISICGQRGETVEVIFSEEITPDGKLDTKFGHSQKFTVICDSKERTVRPLFTWFGYRYFSVCGNADVECVEVVYTDVDTVSSFECDSDILNWIHDTFINTQLTNMHAGIPSDCPHIERRGYTGDGQLVCHAAMNIFDAESFYRKWIKDITDCQDSLSGHVQYTAPYIRSGGGPGGWGGAIVEVPYRFYLHYGDESVLRDCYQGILRYFDYLEANSYGNLIVRDKEGEWCLGDWCTPEAIILPPPFVNNYFYIKNLYKCIEIAKIIGKHEDIPIFESRIKERKEALMAAYYNKSDGNFLGCRQGANAFAVDIGIGDDRTYPNLVKYYTDLGGYDTGIFGTDVVTRVLFEHGDGDLAVKLLSSDSVHSFSEMRRLGATTIWEYWPCSLRNRSHNHPMFGAVVAYLYDYILGIKSKDSSAGYREIEISPALTDSINRVSGYRTLPLGKVSVSYEKTGSSISFSIDIPKGQIAVFSFAGVNQTLSEGENKIIVSI